MKRINVLRKYGIVWQLILTFNQLWFCCAAEAILPRCYHSQAKEQPQFINRGFCSL
jgi:hypothetical protein